MVHPRPQLLRNRLAVRFAIVRAIDGAIDSAFIREMFGDAPEKRGPDAMLAPDDIAETYWNIHAQRRSAWTFETDLRPWLEPW